MKEIIIDISDEGEVKIETRGFTGKACVKESEFIKQAAESLGIESSQIDAILQPVASSFMVLESLFPRKS